MPRLTIVDADDATVWRVGRAPDPWAWVDRRYAGRQRWDDADGVFRTVYAADSLFACFVELLAFARPDLGPDGAGLLDGIDEAVEDARQHPTPAPGSIPIEWVRGRMLASATLSGAFADVRTAETIAALRPSFLATALACGHADFDASALRSASPRTLTQRVATHLYARMTSQGSAFIDGVRFASRHGDELTLWAIFERPGDEPASQRLDRGRSALVTGDESDLARALALHGLRWS